MKKILNKKKFFSTLVLIIIGILLFSNTPSNAFINTNGRFVDFKEVSGYNPILIDKDTLFFPGGYNPQTKEIIKAKEYNITSKVFKDLNISMDIPRLGYNAIQLSDGKVLIMGGYNDISKKNNPYRMRSKLVDIYDPKTQTFRRISDMNFERVYNTKSVLLNDGRVFIISSVSKPEIFDPKTEKFKKVGKERECGMITSGVPSIPNETRYCYTLNDCSQYTPVLLKDGRVLLVGAYPSKKHIDSNNAEIFDPKTNQFLPTGRMMHDRFNPTATLLPDGKVLVAGGGMWGYEDAELFDPKTNKFTPTGSLNQGRYYHSAILLSNGKVLIVNGTHGADEMTRKLKVAELYDPKTGKFTKIGSTKYDRFLTTLIHINENTVLITNGGDSVELYKY